MKKVFFPLGIAIAILMLLADPAYSRGGGMRGGGGGGGNENNNSGNNTARATPTPTPAPPAPVQGIITSVTPFAVSIKPSPITDEQTYKVGNSTTITVNGIPSTIAALKPGMVATITPAADKIYATNIVAAIPAAPTPPPATASNRPQQPQGPPGATPIPAAPPASNSGQYSPFGTAMPQ